MAEAGSGLPPLVSQRWPRKAYRGQYPASATPNAATLFRDVSDMHAHPLNLQFLSAKLDCNS
jgi:hypothetical protein